MVSRFSFWFNVPLLIFFMAANLLPPQVIITPLYELYLRIHLPDLDLEQRPRSTTPSSG